jgi:uncharacterized membrane protein
MKGISVVGLILIVLGVVALAYQGFSYTTEKKAVDMGPIQINKKENHNVPLPPILGGVAIVGGLVLVVLGQKKS